MSIGIEVLAGKSKKLLVGGKYCQQDIVVSSPPSAEGDISRALGDIIAFQKELLGVITFSIDGVSYEAKEGMTWAEWVDSEYNTIGAYPDGSYISIEKDNDTLDLFYGLTEDFVYEIATVNDTISSGHNYTFEEGWS